MTAFPFHLAILLVSLAAGAIASVSGFGIGSLLTPLLAASVGMKTAVAAVSVPHFVATLLRLWGLRKHIDRRVLLHFGTFSAAGGLLGALFQSRANSPVLTAVFGVLLLFAGISGWGGWLERMRFRPGTAWGAGALSGLFGGLVGNQGGIRSAALLSFNMRRESLVATATATGVIVDVARMPVYLATQTHTLLAMKFEIAIALAGCLIGTVWGFGILKRIPEPAYKRALSLLICALGIFMISRLKM